MLSFIYVLLRLILFIVFWFAATWLCTVLIGFNFTSLFWFPLTGYVAWMTAGKIMSSPAELKSNERIDEIEFQRVKNTKSLKTAHAGSVETSGFIGPKETILTNKPHSLTEDTYKTDKLPKEPQPINEFVPEVDACEWPKGRPETSYKIKLSLTFSYIDNGQQKSRRTVDFFEQMVFPPERKFLRGICRIRNEERIFVMRKMKNVIDATTGEIIDDVFKYVKDEWKNSPGIALGRWFDEHSNFLVLKGISHILRMHGPASDNEYGVVIRMACELMERDDFDAEAIDMACEIVFPKKSISGVMNNIVRSVPDSWHLFKETAEAIIEARGGIDEDDQKILEDLRKYENRLITNMARDRHDWLPANGKNSNS